MSDTPGVELYRSASGGFELAVHADAETVWLSADQLVALFSRDKSTISRHLRNVFVEGELDREAVVADSATTAADCKTYRCSPSAPAPSKSRVINVPAVAHSQRQNHKLRVAELAENAIVTNAVPPDSGAFAD